MSFTKVVGPGIHTLAQLRTHNIHSAGIITATKFVGEMESGGGDSTFQNVTVNGNLTVQGDTTTLNTTLRNVELLRVASNSATTAGIITQTGTGDILNLFDGTTERMTVVDGGNVGFGVTNPYYKLDSRFSNGAIVLSGGSGGDWTGNGLRLENENTTNGTMSLIHFRTGDADWHVGTKRVGSNDSDLIFLQEGINERLRIKADGKVGIGTDTIDGNLHVYNSTAGSVTAAGDANELVLESAANVGMSLLTGATSIARIKFGSPTANNRGVFAYRHDDDAFTFNLAGDERLRITTIGDLLLGNHGSRIFDDSSGTNVVVDIYGGTTAGKRGILALGGRTGSDDADIGTIQFVNENNNLATAANHVQSKLVASIDVKSETTDGNAGSDSGGHLLFSTKGENAVLTEALRIDSSGHVLIGIDASTANDALLQSFKPTGNDSTITVGNVATSASGLSRLDFAPSNSTIGARIECHATEDFSTVAKRTADLVFVTRKDGTHSEKLRIDSDGNIWANKANPQSSSLIILDKDGSGEAAIRFYNAGANTAKVALDSSEELTFDVNGDERLRITSGGDLIVGGHSSVVEPGGYASHLEILGTGTDAGASIVRYSASAGGPSLVFGKSRNATIGSITKVQENDNLGKIQFYGVDTGWEPGAAIQAFADGEWFSGSVGAEDNTDSPGRLSFWTTPNGSDDLQERLRINSAGQLLIGDTISRAAWGVSGRLQLNGTSWDHSTLLIQNFGNNTNRPLLLFTKGRGGSLGNYGTPVNANEGLGIIGWSAHDTTNADHLSAYIQCISTSQPTADNQYGAITFTTMNGTSTSEKLRIAADGKIGIGEVSPQTLLHLSSNNNGVGTGVTSAINRIRFTDTDTDVTSGQPTGTIEWETREAHNPGTNAYISVKSTNTGYSSMHFGTGTDDTLVDRLSISQDGRFNMSPADTMHTQTQVHIQAASTVSSGETIVNIEGSNASAGARLLLQNNNTGGSAYNEILGTDAGGQSTSSIRFYNTDQTNNYGQIAFGTRNVNNAPPSDRMVIDKDGNVTINNGDLIVGSGDFRLTSGQSNAMSYQIITGAKTFPGSDSYVELFHCGHSHTIEIDYIIYENGNPSLGGVHGKIRFITAYGYTNYGSEHDKFRQAANGGRINSDPSFQYVNSGGSVSYLIRAKVSYTSGSDNFTIRYAARGLASAAMYPLS